MCRCLLRACGDGELEEVRPKPTNRSAASVIDDHYTNYIRPCAVSRLQSCIVSQPLIDNQCRQCSAS